MHCTCAAALKRYPPFDTARVTMRSKWRELLSRSAGARVHPLCVARFHVDCAIGCRVRATLIGRPRANFERMMTMEFGGYKDPLLVVILVIYRLPESTDFCICNATVKSILVAKFL